MKKIIYFNIISMIVFFLMPPFIYENYYVSGTPDKYVNYTLVVIFIVVLFLLYLNIKSAIKSKGRERVASIIFIIPPAFVLLYFILGYIAFSRYSILG